MTDSTLPPFEKNSWQDAVDAQLVNFARTSQDFMSPQEAVEWLLNETANYAVACSPSAPLLAEIDRLKAQVAELVAKDIPKEHLSLNTRHKDCHKAADAFWEYWNENGETHKHGYYESTWGAINQALRTVGVIEHAYTTATEVINTAMKEKQ